MHKHEFCYWLQGYFELREGNEHLTDSQIECIKKHIKLVETVEKKLEGFPAWLMGMLDAYEKLQEVGGMTEEGRQEMNQMVRDRLNSVFKHEVDGKYGGKELQEVLDEIHNPTKPSFPNHNGPYCGKDKLIRC